MGVCNRLTYENGIKVRNYVLKPTHYKLITSKPNGALILTFPISSFPTMASVLDRVYFIENLEMRVEFARPESMTTTSGANMADVLNKKGKKNTCRIYQQATNM